MADNKTYNFYEGSQNVEHIDHQVNNYYYSNKDKDSFIDEDLRKRIDSVLPLMNRKKHWFCIAKVLMVSNLIAEGDFKAAETIIRRIYSDEVPFGINAEDMSELNRRSMRLNPKEWNPEDSPIIKGFKTYHSIALLFLNFFEN